MEVSKQTLIQIEELSEELEQLHLEHESLGQRIYKVSQELNKLTKPTKKPKAENASIVGQRERKVILDECRRLVGRKVRIVRTQDFSTSVSEPSRKWEPYT